MKMLRPARPTILLALALALLAGCGDLIVDAGRQVTGVTVQDATGATLVTVQGTQVGGSLTVPRNAQRTLVFTLQGSGGPLSPTLAETIRVTVTNPGVASWQDTGTGTGALRGHSPGVTTLRVDLLRDGAVTYTSPAISVTVS
jgi:hypothetical protein